MGGKDYIKLSLAGILFLLLCLQVVSVSNAASEITATLRIGKHADHMRIVLESTEDYVQRASVTLTGDNAIKIDFRAAVFFKLLNKGVLKPRVAQEIARGMKVVAHENYCIITMNSLDDIAVSKLSSPPRLVIDAFMGPAADSSAAQMKEEPAPQVSNPQESVPPVTGAFEALEGMTSFVIDAGHGGRDTGARCGKSVEKDIVLQLAKNLADVLVKNGKKVFLTRKGDQYISIRERIKTSNRKAADLVISLHMSCRNEFALYSFPSHREKSVKAVAKVSTVNEKKNRNAAVLQALVTSLGAEFKLKVTQENAPAGVVAGIHAPAILIELPGGDGFAYDAKTREKLVNALLRVLLYTPPVQA
jgi:N-acetylmuramoyl-L-alanine amidase